MRGLIFDFDGVIADSESLANMVLAEQLTRLGRVTTLDDALMCYSGRRWADVVAEIEKHIGRALPGDFSKELHAATLERFRGELREVEGAGAFVRRFPHVPHCIASSSASGRLTLCLELLGLEDAFGERVFSAEMVARGKPHPDLFLLAAERMGIMPADCLVIEDSALGIQAAQSAGMTSVGLCAGSHIRHGHELKLREAGAVHIALSWAEVGEIAGDWLRVSGSPSR